MTARRRRGEGQIRATSRRKVEVADAEKQTFLQINKLAALPALGDLLDDDGHRHHRSRWRRRRRRAARALGRAALVELGLFFFGPGRQAGGLARRARRHARFQSDAHAEAPVVLVVQFLDGADGAEFLIKNNRRRRRAALVLAELDGLYTTNLGEGQAQRRRVLASDIRDGDGAAAGGVRLEEPARVVARRWRLGGRSRRRRLAE